MGHIRSIRRSRSVLLLILVIGAIAVGCTNDSGIVTEAAGKKVEIFIGAGMREAQPQRGLGMLIGIVSRGPISPVEGLGGFRTREPIPGARIIISGLGGQVIKSVVTDDEGGYSISLPPGTYRIDMAPLDRTWFSKELPATVTITEGQESRMDIRIESGIR